jgi:chemotaxis protein MotB
MCIEISRIMKKQAKNKLKNDVILIPILLLITGCVSNKKYNAAIQELDKANESIAKLEVDKTLEEYDNESIRFTKNEEIYNKQQELIRKSRKLDSLERIVMNQREQLMTTKNFMNENVDEGNWMVEELDGKLYIELENDILFDKNSFKISAEGQKTINSIVKAIMENEQKLNVMIVGHTDDLKFQSEEYDNWDLSSQRSLSVTREFIKNGISPEKITSAAKSEYEPVMSNDSESGRKANRRTEIILIPESKNDQYYNLLSQK